MLTRSPDDTVTREPRRGRVAADEPEHGTFGPVRTVLVIARTITSTARLLDALRFFRDDFRVDLVFTVNDTSPHSGGALELLREARAERIVPWSAVHDLPYALAISASENIDFAELDLTRPVVVLPHGIGFNKHVHDPKTGGTRLAGLPPDHALRSGKVLLTLAHESQHRQLLAVRPEVAGNTAVVGDPTFDQLRASLPLRDRFRRELDPRGRRLVLLSSTWGGESALGRCRELARRLCAQLPADEYRVVLAMHPNIWSRYGDLRVRTWFADALDAGVLLLPPDGGWQAALVAADQVVGDHGSVSLYAACLGKPVLLAAVGSESVPGTPVEVLARTAAHLDADGDLRAQLAESWRAHDPARSARLAGQVFAHLGEATGVLREVLYRALDLPVPDGEPPLLQPADPRPYRREPASFEVFTEFTGPDRIAVRRYPAAVLRADAPVRESAVPRHLAVREDEPRLLRHQSAAVLVREGTCADEAAALAWTDAARAEFPGARVLLAAHPDGMTARIRSGRTMHLSAPGADPMLVASAAHTIVLNGLIGGAFTISCGAEELRLTATER
ncbi:UDP-N-acetyl glucosamine 2-epimerase [Saccharopolyspora gregorii]|uniref:hypothetical protein n=1 Tax=Saccharopolyspora gregorii TaxID=33914 RepID=UPI0021AC5EE7|nr:hypothetical protein [Saccharopolyspora gregorii]